jgi:predicted AAA+ superfamily ATPase
MALRYFFEEIPELHVIAASSLLEFAIKDSSFPVGRVQFLNLYPLTFSEYLAAINHDTAAHTILDKPGKVSDTTHDFLCEELRRYLFVGGMPESVKVYAETGSMKESFEVQAELSETYRMDFAKYAPHSNKQCLNAVFTSSAKNVGSQTKYSKLAEGYSNPTLKKAYDLLHCAGVIRKVPSADPSGLPLGAKASLKIFKTIMADIGIMRYLTGMPVEVEYLLLICLIFTEAHWQNNLQARN